MASPTGESSSQKDSNRQLEPLDDRVAECFFETLQEWSAELGRFPEGREIYLPQGVLLSPGQRLVQPCFAVS
jgi:hypothetical protein